MVEIADAVTGPFEVDVNRQEQRVNSNRSPSLPLKVEDLAAALRQALFQCVGHPTMPTCLNVGVCSSTVGHILLTFGMNGATSLAQAYQITINVDGAADSPSGGALQFNPTLSNATNGTVVICSLNLCQPSYRFDVPCEPLAGGFDSGFIGIAAVTTPLPQWNALVFFSFSSPLLFFSIAIWFFCKQAIRDPSRCAVGMVGGLTPPPLAPTFLANAKAATFVGQAAGGLVGVGASASAEPVVPSGAVHFVAGASASATAPASGSVRASEFVPGSTQTQNPSSAVAMSLNTNVGVLVALIGAFAGGAMVL
ncbi:hypothetical protein B0H16DRAFT_1473369 [Mycena metata]|uniref:Uncharacterized protein n=1 Tax=Mycena metata TaxID=1033252 RepID=A0AAD7HJU8_9AGAR|nr:hypothetical protein B0H16DRAFT_1473369 [Mycena metata]